ncbi:MAG: DUF3873 family protein [Oscillospiraceae bacterium]|nr:DUF3873 family protein [Oscillospiraceae bacterium]
MLDPRSLENGEEQYETFERRCGLRERKVLVQYDYRDAVGELFSTVKPTLDECRAARDEWLKSKEMTCTNP